MAPSEQTAQSTHRALPPLTIRRATDADLPAMVAIYAPYVQGTAISFELVPPSIDDFRERLHKCRPPWAWLAAEADGRLLGYAYGGPHRERYGYRLSVETSVYVAEGAHRRGVGRALYAALLPLLAEAGFCNAYAGITLPNEASVALHRSLGFEPVGVFPRIGRKFDRWHDVGWFHRVLREEPHPEAA